jgi:hypothetical protein
MHHRLGRVQGRGEHQIKGRCFKQAVWGSERYDGQLARGNGSLEAARDRFGLAVMV